jgi:hypothetical protein
VLEVVFERAPGDVSKQVIGLKTKIERTVFFFFIRRMGEVFRTIY